MSNIEYEENKEGFPLSIAIAISLIFTLLGIIHILFPSFVDMITIVLLVIVILVWLPNLASMELPGGIKLNFTKKVKDAVNQIVGDQEPEINQNNDFPIYKQIFEIDPNLTMVYFRIEIELRIRELAEKYGIQTNRSLKRTLDELSKKDDFIRKISGSLSELIFLGNEAAHGANVPRDAAIYMLNQGPKIIALLDKKLN